MNIFDLKCFQAVAICGNQTKAAQMLSISQPTLSSIILRLEKNVGVPLFVRSGRSITLNEYGQYLLGRIAQPLKRIDDAQQMLGSMKNFTKDRSRIYLVSNSLICYRGLLRQISERYPHLMLWYLHNKNNDPHFPMNDPFDIMLGMALPPRASENAFCKKLIYRKLYLLVSEKHRFTSRENGIDLAECVDEHFVVNDCETGEQSRLLRRLCALSGFTPYVSSYVCSSDEICHCVSTGNFVALSDDSVMSKAMCFTKKHHVVALPLTAPVRKVPLLLLVSSKKPPNTAVQGFVELIINYFSGITSEEDILD